MSNYCDFNPRLFKEFTSMKTKIKPGLANDWVMIPKKYRTTDGFSLRSETLNQEVADINLRRFLRFSEEQDLNIQGLKLQGTFVVGNDRSVYTEEMYNEWKAKFNKRTEILLEKKDLIPGHSYKTPCGRVIVYLGSKYISRLKKSEEIDFQFSKITKVHFCAAYDWQSKPTLTHPMNEKCTEDLGEAMSKKEVDKLLEIYYRRDMSIVCFQDTLPKLKEVTIDDIKLIQITPTIQNYMQHAVVAKIEGELYVTQNYSKQMELNMSKIDNSGIELISYSAPYFEIKDFKLTGKTKTQTSRYGWSFSNEIIASEVYRINIKEN